MKRILLFEMFSHGHSVNSLQLLLESYEFSKYCSSERGRITLLISEKVARDLSAILQRVEHFVCVKTFKTLENMSSWKSRCVALLYLFRELRECKYDKLVVLEGDLQCVFAPFIRCFAWRCEILYLIFRPIMHYRSAGYPCHLYRGRRYIAPLIKNWLSIFFYRCRFISGFLFEDLGAVQWCAQQKIKARQLLTPSIAIVTPRQPSSDVMRFTLFGVLSEGKNVSAVFRAWSHIPENLRMKAHLRVIGRCVDEDKTTIHEAYKSVFDKGVIFEDRFIENSEVGDLYATSDVMLLLYSPTHVGGSGVLVQSAAFGLPVLATNIGWIGYTTKKYNLGEVVDLDNDDSLSQVFSRCISNGVKFNPCTAREFSRTYAPEEYVKSFISILSEDS